MATAVDPAAYLSALIARGRNARRPVPGGDRTVPGIKIDDGADLMSAVIAGGRSQRECTERPALTPPAAAARPRDAPSHTPPSTRRAWASRRRGAASLRAAWLLATRIALP